MRQVRLQASWMDGEVFRGLWAPLPDAEEFLLISCYVSDPAWEALERTLRQHLRRPTFQCTLIFSLAGMAATASRALLDRLYLLVSDHPPEGRVQAFVIDDRASALFHPKAHGSRAGQRTRVVVGSANLTSAAANDNYEMMVVLEDDPESYQALRKAISGLEAAEPIQITRRTIEALRNATAARSALERAAPVHRAPDKRRSTEPLLADKNYKALLPTAPTYEQAWLSVRALLSRGGYVARIDQLDSLIVSVPLGGFRQAGLLATPHTREIGAGVSYETSGSSITVSLVPHDLRQELMKLTKPLGKLIGRFSIECLGGRWMPIAWDREFRGHWESIAEPGWLREAEHKVREHVQHLARELGERGSIRQQLGQQLDVLAPSHWVESSVRRMLHWDAEHRWPRRLSPALRDEVVRAVLEHITSTVERHLSPKFVMAQISQVGRGPLLRQQPLESITAVDALLVLSEWAMAGVMSRLRSASGELSQAPGRSGVTQVLADRFDAKTDSPQDVVQTALHWQNIAAGRHAVSERDIFGTLAHAWSLFVRWYGLTPEQISWDALVPAWSSRGTTDEETSRFGSTTNVQVAVT